MKIRECFLARPSSPVHQPPLAPLALMALLKRPSTKQHASVNCSGSNLKVLSPPATATLYFAYQYQPKASISSAPCLTQQLI